jgi:hypothetical protein
MDKITEYSPIRDYGCSALFTGFLLALFPKLNNFFLGGE